MAMAPVLTVVQEPNPEVVRAKCCTNQPGLTVRVNGQWRFVAWNPKITLRDDGKGSMGLFCWITPLCRGCFTKLTDRTPTEPWEWGLEPAIDDLLRAEARRIADGGDDLK